jgi:hypothetical protein
MQGSLAHARPKEKKAESAGDVVAGSLLIVIFGCNLDRAFEMLTYVYGGETHELLRQLGNEVAEGSQSTARDCESAMGVCLKRSAVSASESDA